MKTRNEEFNALIKEYNDFLKSATRNNDDTLTIETNEGNEYKITVDSQGWQVVGSNNDDQIFETCEALLMDLSPQFAKQWHGELFSKLNELSKLQQNDE